MADYRNVYKILKDYQFKFNFAISPLSFLNHMMGIEPASHENLALRLRPLPTREYDVEEGGGGDRACRMDDREVVARQGLVLQLVSHVLTLLRSVWGGGPGGALARQLHVLTLLMSV